MSEFYSILTAKGLAKVAALAVGETIRLTHMAFGNSTNLPFEDMTELSSEKHRCELIKVVSANNQIVAEAILLGNVGGFWVREIGVIDADGDLFAVGKYPATYKPEASEGTVKELGVRMVLEVSNTDAIVTYNMGIIDGAANTDLDNLTFVGQQKFDNKADLSDMTEKLALKAPLASPELTGVPTAPTAIAGTNTAQLATTAFVWAAIADLVQSSPEALDTLEELAAALGNDPNFATTITNILATKATIESLDELSVALTNALNGKLSISGGAMSGTLIASSTGALNTLCVRNTKAIKEDPGVDSELSTGCILLVYEE